MKIEEISTLQENGKYACVACGKEYTRKGISTHYWLKHGDGGAHLEYIRNVLRTVQKTNRGKPAWNRGLTAETDERVKHSRDTLIKKIEAGEFNNGWIGKHLSIAMKERLSEVRSCFLSERGNGGFKDVKWFKIIDSFGNECSVRGTWELDVAKWLDSHNVKWTRKFFMKYLDGDVMRTYSPDFYIPLDNRIIEVKGYFSAKDKHKMSLVEDQHREVDIVYIFKKEMMMIESTSYTQLVAAHTSRATIR